MPSSIDESSLGNSKVIICSMKWPLNDLTSNYNLQASSQPTSSASSSSYRSQTITSSFTSEGSLEAVLGIR